MPEVTIRQTRIEVREADITTLEVDAVVNAANSQLTMGGGVAGAIRRVGGAEIEQEARRHAPIPIGQAIHTNAGKLPCRYVLHAPTMEHPGPTTAENAYRATGAALRLAEQLQLTSLAIPGMGTGVGGVAPHAAARAIVRAVHEHLLTQLSTTLRLIILSDRNPDMIRAFSSELPAGGPD